MHRNTRITDKTLKTWPEQAMLGDSPKAVDDAILDSQEAHHNQMMQLLADPQKASGFARVVFNLLQGVDW